MTVTLYVERAVLRMGEEVSSGIITSDIIIISLSLDDITKSGVSICWTILIPLHGYSDSKENQSKEKHVKSVRLSL